MSLRASPTQLEDSSTAAVVAVSPSGCTDRSDLNLNLVPTSNTSGVAENMATPQKRKAPHCSKCKRPRKDHPRSGCPFTDMPPPTTLNVSGISGVRRQRRGMGTSDMEAAVAPSPNREALMESKLEILFSPSESLEETAARLSLPEVLNNDVNDIFVESKHFRVEEPPIAAAVATNPSASNVIQSSKTKLPMQPCMPNIASNILLSPSDLSQKQGLTSTASVCFQNEQQELEEISEPDRVVQQCHSDPELILQSMSAVKRDSFALMLSEQALATIFIIPNADADAIFNQTAALKLKMELLASKRNDPKGPCAPIILDNSEENLKAFQAFISTAMTGTANNRSVRRPGCGLSMLQAAAAAAIVGAIGAWSALAFI